MTLQVSRSKFGRNRRSFASRKNFPALAAASVEALETRRLLSFVTDIGTLYSHAGNSWTYEVLSGTGTVDGSITFHAQGQQTSGPLSGAELDATTTTTNGPNTVTLTDKDFFNNTSAGFGDNGNQETTTLNGAQTSSSTTTYSPEKNYLPASMVAGQTYTSNFTRTTTTTFNGMSPTMTVESETTQFMLASNSTQSMTVAGGTFNVFEVDVTDTTTPQGGSPTTSTSEDFFAIGAGLIKSVDGPLASPTGVTELQADTVSGGSGGGGGGGGGGGTGTAAVTPAISGKLPTSSLLAGQKTPLSQTVTITDTGAAYSGAATVKLLLDTGTTVDTNAISLPAQLSKSLKLKTNAHAAFKLSFKLPATVPQGIYHVLVQLTDKSGNTSVAATTGTITVAPAEIDLAGTFSKAVVPGKGGKTPLTFTVSDSGNTAAVGTLTFNVDSSPDGQLADATVITTPSKKINIKPGKSTKITAVVTLPAGTYFVVIQLDPADAFHDVNLANNVFAGSAAVTVA